MPQIMKSQIAKRTLNGFRNVKFKRNINLNFILKAGIKAKGNEKKLHFTFKFRKTADKTTINKGPLSYFKLFSRIF